MYGAKHTHFIYSFEGERKKSQLGKSIQKVINMHHLSYFLIVKGENPFRCTTHDEKGLVLNAILFYPIF
jgi:hypothetical protein